MNCYFVVWRGVYLADILLSDVDTTTMDSRADDHMCVTLAGGSYRFGDRLNRH